jgi:hypothetical protein
LLRERREGRAWAGDVEASAGLRSRAWCAARRPGGQAARRQGAVQLRWRSGAATPHTLLAPTRDVEDVRLAAGDERLRHRQHGAEVACVVAVGHRMLRHVEVPEVQHAIRVHARDAVVAVVLERRAERAASHGAQHAAYGLALVAPGRDAGPGRSMLLLLLLRRRRRRAALQVPAPQACDAIAGGHQARCCHGRDRVTWAAEHNRQQLPQRPQRAPSQAGGSESSPCAGSPGLSCACGGQLACPRIISRTRCCISAAAVYASRAARWRGAMMCCCVQR